MDTNKPEDSIIEIIKGAFIECIKAETSSEEGRVNLIGGIFCLLLIVMIHTTSFIDKLIWCLNNSYQFGIPWYASIILIILLGVYFIYCIKWVRKKNKIEENTSNASQK